MHAISEPIDNILIRLNPEKLDNADNLRIRTALRPNPDLLARSHRHYSVGRNAQRCKLLLVAVVTTVALATMAALLISGGIVPALGLAVGFSPIYIATKEMYDTEGGRDAKNFKYLLLTLAAIAALATLGTLLISSTLLPALSLATGVSPTMIVMTLISSSIFLAKEAYNSKPSNEKLMNDKRVQRHCRLMREARFKEISEKELNELYALGVISYMSREMIFYHQNHGSMSVRRFEKIVQHLPY